MPRSSSRRLILEGFKRASQGEERLEERAVRSVEINQCVGRTRQFFTKSFRGDGAAVLARSSGEEPASPRHRAGVASMRVEDDATIQHERAVNLISTQAEWND